MSLNLNGLWWIRASTGRSLTGQAQETSMMQGVFHTKIHVTMDTNGLPV